MREQTSTSLNLTAKKQIIIPGMSLKKQSKRPTIKIPQWILFLGTKNH